MAVMTQEVQDLFNKVPNVVFATANADGQANASICGMKFVIDEETVYLSDQFFKKTLANALENPKVAVVFWEGQNAYQIHGTARYVNEGPEFEPLAAKVNAIFEQIGIPFTTKGGFFVKVDSVYISAAGPKAGEQIA